MILLIGGDGNMGQRYQAILRYLGKEFTTLDIGHSETFTRDLAAKSDGVLICSPTETHVPYLKLLRGLKKPILCEKPFTKDVLALQEIMDEYAAEKWPVSMVYQYSILANQGARGLSYYNYFKHGNDGLAWDCIQIIGLANGRLELEEDSPEWRCSINGDHLNIGMMDIAYIAYVRKWLAGASMDPKEILDIHHKTHLVAEGLRHG